MAPNNVVIVGAGVVGLSTAFALATRQVPVTIFDPFPGQGASHVAAGMIAPITEATYGEESLVSFSVESMRRWPGFAQAVARHTELDCGLDTAGTLSIALDANDRSLLRAQVPLYEQTGLSVTWHTSDSARELEPLLSPNVRGGLEAQSDIQVDNRRLLSALSDALRGLGVRFVRERVTGLGVEGGRVTGVTSNARFTGCECVVIATGYDVASIQGIPSGDVITLRPVKGQILRLFQRDPALRLSRTVRALVAGTPVYLVPRASGQVVIGATVEEQGPSHHATAGAIYGLLRDAISVVPSIAEAQLQHVDVGLRPAALDNAPVLGPANCEGLIYALGCYRHGILFSPLVAESIAEFVVSGSLPSIAEPFRPGRLLPRHPDGLQRATTTQ